MRYIAFSCILAFAGWSFGAGETTVPVSNGTLQTITMRNGKRVIDPLPPGYESQEAYFADMAYKSAVYYQELSPKQREMYDSRRESSDKWEKAQELGLHEIGDGVNGLYGTTGPGRIVRDDLITSSVKYSSTVHDVYPYNGDKFVNCWQNRTSDIYYAGDTKPQRKGRGNPFEIVFKAGVEVTTETIESVMVSPDFSKRKVILSSPER